MPTYDYVCTACGREVEIVHSLHGDGPATCVECGGAMKRSFAPPTVHFKGSGWARKERSGRSSAADKSRAARESGETSTTGGSGETGAAGSGAAGSGAAGGGAAAEAKPSGDGH